MSDIDESATDVADTSGGEAWQYAEGDGQWGAEAEADDYSYAPGTDGGGDPWATDETAPYAPGTDETLPAEQGVDGDEDAFFEALEDMSGEGVLTLAAEDVELDGDDDDDEADEADENEEGSE